jgi:hypothetical protein
MDEVEVAWETKSRENSATLDTQVRVWLETVLKTTIPSVEEKNAHELLQDGVLLCQAINSVAPGKISKFHPNPKLGFHQMENISKFLKACSELGIPANQLFSTLDLYEGKDLKKVLSTVALVAKAAALQDEKFTAVTIPTGTGASPVVKKRVIIKTTPAPPSPLFQRRESSSSPGNKRSSISQSTVRTQEASAEKLFDGILAASANRWLDAVLDYDVNNTDESLLMDDVEISPEFSLDSEEFYNLLKDGVKLAKCLNRLSNQNLIGTIHENVGRNTFKPRENLEQYLQACQNLGLPRANCFSVNDLVEKKDLHLVVSNIHCLSAFVRRCVQQGSLSWTGPLLEPITRKTQTSKPVSMLELIREEQISAVHQSPQAPASVDQTSANISIAPVTSRSQFFSSLSSSVLAVPSPHKSSDDLSTEDSHPTENSLHPTEDHFTPSEDIYPTGDHSTVPEDSHSSEEARSSEQTFPEEAQSPSTSHMREEETSSKSDLESFPSAEIGLEADSDVLEAKALELPVSETLPHEPNESEPTPSEPSQLLEQALSPPQEANESPAPEHHLEPVESKSLEQSVSGLSPGAIDSHLLVPEELPHDEHEPIKPEQNTLPDSLPTDSLKHPSDSPSNGPSDCPSLAPIVSDPQEEPLSEVPLSERTLVVDPPQEGTFVADPQEETLSEIPLSEELLSKETLSEGPLAEIPQTQAVSEEFQQVDIKQESSEEAISQSTEKVAQSASEHRLPQQSDLPVVEELSETILNSEKISSKTHLPGETTPLSPSGVRSGSPSPANKPSPARRDSGGVAQQNSNSWGWFSSVSKSIFGESPSSTPTNSPVLTKKNPAPTLPEKQPLLNKPAVVAPPSPKRQSTNSDLGSSLKSFLGNVWQEIVTPVPAASPPPQQRSPEAPKPSAAPGPVRGKLRGFAAQFERELGNVRLQV